MYDYVFLISLYRFILLLLNKSWHDCSSLLDFLYKNSAEIIQNGHMHFHYFLHIDISCASANNFYTAWLNCNLYLNIILWWWFFLNYFFLRENRSHWFVFPGEISECCFLLGKMLDDYHHVAREDLCSFVQQFNENSYSYYVNIYLYQGLLWLINKTNSLKTQMHWLQITWKEGAAVNLEIQTDFVFLFFFLLLLLQLLLLVVVNVPSFHWTWRF